MRLEEMQLYGIDDGELPTAEWARVVVGCQITGYMIWPSSSEERRRALRAGVSLSAASMREGLLSRLREGDTQGAMEMERGLKGLEALSPSVGDISLFHDVESSEKALERQYQTATYMAANLLALKQAGLKGKEENSLRKVATLLDRMARDGNVPKSSLKGISAIQTAFRNYFSVVHFWLAFPPLQYQGYSREELYTSQLEKVLSLSRSLASDLREFGSDDAFQWVVPEGLRLPEPPQVRWPVGEGMLEMLPRYRGDALDGSRLV